MNLALFLFHLVTFHVIGECYPHRAQQTVGAYLQTLDGKHIKPSFPCDMGSAMTEICTGGVHIRTSEEQGRLLGDEDPWDWVEYARWRALDHIFPKAQVNSNAYRCGEGNTWVRQERRETLDTECALSGGRVWRAELCQFCLAPLGRIQSLCCQVSSFIRGARTDRFPVDILPQRCTWPHGAKTHSVDAGYQDWGASLRCFCKDLGLKDLGKHKRFLSQGIVSVLVFLITYDNDTLITWLWQTIQWFLWSCYSISNLYS